MNRPRRLASDESSTPSRDYLYKERSSLLSLMDMNRRRLTEEARKRRIFEAKRQIGVDALDYQVQERRVARSRATRGREALRRRRQAAGGFGETAGETEAGRDS
ncbi:hypothetical protein CDAR_199381 [Caerostris darwini]|uniref:IBB domain-containing protein n=1 Tax=Caerostris darwini TaxID=1538125 RepID=A0AAV4X480_9ARAC|nr:hypothetical protein CDAR_199381 [Caerostris darwini]